MVLARIPKSCPRCGKASFDGLCVRGEFTARGKGRIVTDVQCRWCKRTFVVRLGSVEKLTIDSLHGTTMVRDWRTNDA